jgi:hypothetical protein
MLKLFLLPQLPNAGTIYLQMDGAPPHYSDLVRVALDEKFSHGLVEVDLHLGLPEAAIQLFLIFSFGGTSRTLCMPKVRDLKHLKDKICTAIETVTP